MNEELVVMLCILFFLTYAHRSIVVNAIRARAYN